MYLYDIRYNLKTETSYEKVSKIFGITISTLRSCKSNRTRFRKYYYLIDKDTKLGEIKKLYSGYKIKLETWKEVEGSEGEYIISNYGRFKKINKSNPEGKFILPFVVKRQKDVNRNKQFVKIKFKGEYKNHSVSRLVAYHFVNIYDNDLYARKKDDKYKYYKHDDLIVYHKNGLIHDNYHGNLEWLDRIDLGKISGQRRYHGKSIVAKDVEGNIIDYFESTRHAAANLPISKTSVQTSLNKGVVVGGIYKFEYDFKVDNYGSY